MKKRMRKAVAIAATAAMVGSLPMGAVTAQAADDDITIGVSIWSSTDVLGSQSKKIIDKAADALGVNVMYVIQTFVPVFLIISFSLWNPLTDRFISYAPQTRFRSHI